MTNSNGLLGILSVTHSNRVTTLAHCARDYFIKRFNKPGRLENLPDWRSLTTAPKSRHGGISFFAVYRNGDGIGIRHASSFKTSHRVQDVQFLDENHLIVAFETHMEIWNLPAGIPQDDKIHRQGWERIQLIEHPHLVGLRTVHSINDRLVIVASSGADSFFIVDIKDGKVLKRVSMPEDLYGSGFPIPEEQDLHRHYVANNYQRTHINGASAFQDGKKVVISCLIQGAIGVFDMENGDYRELARDYVGCHGARTDDKGRIYFSDSCSGALIFLDDNGKETFRYQHQSKWLHDACQLSGDIYAFAATDSNQLRVVNIATEEELFRHKFLKAPHMFLKSIWALWPNWLGNSIQFLSYYPLPRK